MPSPQRRKLREVRKAPTAVRQAPRDGRYFSRAISKALKVLEILKRSPQPQALHQLTSKVALTKSSLFHSCIR